MAHDHFPHDQHDHSHGHSHGHGHAHHHHAAVSEGNERRVLIAAVLTGAFMAAELAGGLITGSLALLADAAHMLTDFAALFLAWLAFRLSRRPADASRTYGFDRLQILAAFANAVTLLVLVVWILAEAVMRLLSPEPVLASGMLVVAAVGLAVNVAAFTVLHGADRDNLNIRGALVHVMGDLLGSVAALAAAGVILFTGWTPIDPLLSMLIAALITVSAVRLLRDSGRVLLEAAPRGVDPEAIRADLTAHVAGVEDVHHLHVWCLTPERPMATLHVRLQETGDVSETLSAVKRRLQVEFGLDHVTVEIETGTCADKIEC
ncbi:MAG: cation diffusion facilitator family transporter [Oceanicaulis sp.]